MVFANHAISWDLIRTAQQKYSYLGYQNIEVPWIVDNEAIAATLPDGATQFVLHTGKSLVGSAEQSFVDLIIKGALAPGMYQATTPCFRDDPVDEFHQKYFMKVELIRYAQSTDDLKKELNYVISDANYFFQNHVSYSFQDTAEGVDIVDSFFGIELGSYGIRSYKNHSWIYGTGLAEPRLSQVIQKQYER